MRLPGTIGGVSNERRVHLRQSRRVTLDSATDKDRQAEGVGRVGDGVVEALHVAATSGLEGLPCLREVGSVGWACGRKMGNGAAAAEGRPWRLPLRLVVGGKLRGKSDW